MANADHRVALDLIKPAIINGYCICCGDKADETGGCSMCTARTFNVTTGQLIACSCGFERKPKG